MQTQGQEFEDRDGEKRLWGCRGCRIWEANRVLALAASGHVDLGMKAFWVLSCGWNVMVPFDGAVDNTVRQTRRKGRKKKGLLT